MRDNFDLKNQARTLSQSMMKIFSAYKSQKKSCQLSFLVDFFLGVVLGFWIEFHLHKG